MGNDLASADRRAVLQLLSSADLNEDWLASVAASVLEALTDGNPRSGAELGHLEPRLKQAVRAPGRATAKWVPVGSRVLALLAMDGMIERGVPVGSWQSSQVTWTLTPASDPAHSIDRAAAKIWLVRRYLEQFGPATVDDILWWTGMGKRQVTAALTAIEAQHLQLDDGTPVVDIMEAEDRPDCAPAHGIALLPSLDPTVMGWKHREWFLPASMLSELVDRTGNLGPTVWHDGKVVGGWGQDLDGHVRVELFSPVPAAARRLLTEEVEHIQQFLEGRIVRPRFRTPLEQRLAAHEPPPQPRTILRRSA